MPTMIDLVDGEKAGNYTYRVKIETTSNSRFLSGATGLEPQSLLYANPDQLTIAKAEGELAGTAPNFFYGGASLFLRACYQAAASGVPLLLTPDVLWHVILTEVATYVQQDRLAHGDPFPIAVAAPRTVRMPQRDSDTATDWEDVVHRVCQPLQQHVSDEMSGLMLGTFSTQQDRSWPAIQVAFCGTPAAPGIFSGPAVHGIPHIRLGGTAADWLELHGRTMQLSRKFKALSNYINPLLAILSNLKTAASFGLPVTMQQYWRDMFVASHSPAGFTVAGWITSLFAYKWYGNTADRKQTYELDWKDQLQTNGGFEPLEFASHVSTLPFALEYVDGKGDGSARNMLLAAGITGITLTDDGCLQPTLGTAVFRAATTTNPENPEATEERA